MEEGGKVLGGLLKIVIRIRRSVLTILAVWVVAFWEVLLCCVIL
jgi:hypothetical protein